MQFGDRLKELRLSRKLTQKELGDIFNISDRVIGYYESNNRFPKDQDTLVNIAEYFNVSIDYLLGKSSNPELTVEEEIDVAKKFEELKQSLENTDNLMFCGEILDEETRELLLTSLKQTILTSKIISKEREKNKNNKWGGENEQRKTKS